jgi:hypothetical protein
VHQNLARRIQAPSPRLERLGREAAKVEPSSTKVRTYPSDLAQGERPSHNVHCPGLLVLGLQGQRLQREDLYHVASPVSRLGRLPQAVEQLRRFFIVLLRDEQVCFGASALEPRTASDRSQEGSSLCIRIEATLP